VTNRPGPFGTSYADGLFLAVLGLTVIAGFLSQSFRLAGTPRLAYPTYVAHLVLVFVLLVYAPYLKFGHILYRAAALLHGATSTSARAASRPDARPPGSS
jgi:quinone-modifying oxidoreductase, subunit QmoC